MDPAFHMGDAHEENIENMKISCPFHSNRSELARCQHAQYFIIPLCWNHTLYLKVQKRLYHVAMWLRGYVASLGLQFGTKFPKFQSVKMSRYSRKLDISRSNILKHSQFQYLALSIFKFQKHQATQSFKASTIHNHKDEKTRSTFQKLFVRTTGTHMF